ncbi:DUF72 domain-containing protein [Oceanobacillus jeddahense]|uniref:DUF72 domain-containing protein n=1 Tax=Oceanobacillus jeddahense TaxID=1462527 RepID=A0ABY5JUA7_9BACI|nr:DUF72 domain-containing protein [Oceanobacillus jeddahense]UUI03932.1 DUF72 domain-containing protein [Oceanobacillus jeddahense]
MIQIGLTGWGDHDSIYADDTKAHEKLQEYSSHFPVVELDASFYAVQPIHNMEKWVRETPANFQFIVKAYQGMTGHDREGKENPFEKKAEMFQAFQESIEPLQRAGKLGAVLFQFPPWFDCRKENVNYIRYCKQQMNDIPVALEFRQQSWYEERFQQQTLDFMKQEGWIHAIADEPQAGEKSVPFVPVVTTKDKVIIRLHGRNVHGWNFSGNANWRKVRYLYEYNEKELTALAEEVKRLEKQCKEVIVLFNNNSGRHAAGNAKQFQKMLGIEFDGLASQQLGLF